MKLDQIEQEHLKHFDVILLGFGNFSTVYGRSIEEQAKVILEDILNSGDNADNLADLASYWFGNDGVELEAHPSAFSQTDAKIDCDYSRH